MKNSHKIIKVIFWVITQFFRAKDTNLFPLTLVTEEETKYAEQISQITESIAQIFVDVAQSMEEISGCRKDYSKELTKHKLK